MNIQHRAAQVTGALCKGHVRRNRKKYPRYGDDPHSIPMRVFNTELDTLSEINQPEAVKGFNLAFNHYSNQHRRKLA